MSCSLQKETNPKSGQANISLHFSELINNFESFSFPFLAALQIRKRGWAAKLCIVLRNKTTGSVELIWTYYNLIGLVVCFFVVIKVY